ncbi:hypothetical protein ACOME3_003684 [Neoechinorhynchus agilis]
MSSNTTEKIGRPIKSLFNNAFHAKGYANFNQNGTSKEMDEDPNKIEDNEIPVNEEEGDDNQDGSGESAEGGEHNEELVNSEEQRTNGDREIDSSNNTHDDLQNQDGNESEARRNHRELTLNMMEEIFISNMLLTCPIVDLLEAGGDHSSNETLVDLLGHFHNTGQNRPRLSEMLIQYLIYLGRAYPDIDHAEFTRFTARILVSHVIRRLRR